MLTLYKYLGFILNKRLYLTRFDSSEKKRKKDKKEPDKKQITTE